MVIKIHGNTSGANPIPTFGDIINPNDLRPGEEGYDPAVVNMALMDRGYTPETFAALSIPKQKKITRQIVIELRKSAKGRKLISYMGGNNKHSTPPKSMSEVRHESGYYTALREWFRKPMVMEKPQGSSLHHLIDYDMSYHDISLVKEEHSEIHWDEMQNMIVEHDWAKIIGQTSDTGEWRLPFEFCCFEFRISGARILAMLSQDDSSNRIVMPIIATGLVKHWSCSPFEYEIRGSDIRQKHSRGLTAAENDSYVRGAYVSEEYRPLVNFIVRQVRAVSIMLDAQVVQTERVAPGSGVNKNRVREGRALIGGHRVVRLLRRAGSIGGTHGKGNGGGVGGKRGLHMRRGHYRHYSNPDAGSIKYVNDGGFWLSKDWINWMLVGDPDVGIVEKEYRL